LQQEEGVSEIVTPQVYEAKAPAYTTKTNGGKCLIVTRLLLPCYVALPSHGSRPCYIRRRVACSNRNGLQHLLPLSLELQRCVSNSPTAVYGTIATVAFNTALCRLPHSVGYNTVAIHSTANNVTNPHNKGQQIRSHLGLETLSLLCSGTCFLAGTNILTGTSVQASTSVLACMSVWAGTSLQAGM
jgi:hypothetical protein